MDNCYGPRSNQYNLRQRRKPMYLNLRLNIFSYELGDELLHYIHACGSTEPNNGLV